MNELFYRVVTNFRYSDIDFYRDYSDFGTACNVYEMVKSHLIKGESVRLEVYLNGVFVRGYGYKCKGA